MFDLLYRMPIWIVFFAGFFVLCAYGHFISLERVQKLFIWRVLVFLLFCCSVAFIFEITIFSRSETATGVYLMPFRFLSLAKINIEIYRSIIMNVALFIPLGMFTSSLMPYSIKVSSRVLITLFIGIFLSIAVEFTQFILQLGQTETDDVIFNGFGALIGSIVICYPYICKKISKLRHFDIETTKYIALTFLISWTLWAFVSYFTTFYSNYREISTALYIAGNFAPLIGTIILNKKKIISSFVKVNKRSLLYFSIVAALITGLFFLSSFSFRESRLRTLPFDFLKYILIFSLSQEIGWRYTLFPLLKRKIPYTTACILNGLLYSVWLIPSYYMIGSPLSKLPVYMFIFISICFSCILSSVYQNTKCPLLSIMTNAIIITHLRIAIIKYDSIFIFVLTALSIASILISEKTERN